jgi:hypothetical protein
MPSPKDSQHDDARDEDRHIVERGQKRFDVVRDLLRVDHQHGNCESEGSTEPRQRIQVLRQC